MVTGHARNHSDASNPQGLAFSGFQHSKRQNLSYLFMDTLAVSTA
jgi:signal recognition particle GTPase